MREKNSSVISKHSVALGRESTNDFNSRIRAYTTKSSKGHPQSEVTHKATHLESQYLKNDR